MSGSLKVIVSAAALGRRWRLEHFFGKDGFLLGFARRYGWGKKTMRITYDPQADAAMIYLVDRIGPGGAPHSTICDLEVQQGAVILLLSAEERLAGIEVLGASRLLASDALDAAEEPQPPE